VPVADTQKTALFPAVTTMFGESAAIAGAVGAAATLNDTETDCAAANVAFPGWLAVNVTFPVVPVSVTVDPLTVAGPEATAIVTGRPELDTAVTWKGDDEMIWSGGWTKVMSWRAVPTTGVGVGDGVGVGVGEGVGVGDGVGDGVGEGVGVGDGVGDGVGEGVGLGVGVGMAIEPIRTVLLPESAM
jgi:hypothetical protein